MHIVSVSLLVLLTLIFRTTAVVSQEKYILPNEFSGDWQRLVISPEQDKHVQLAHKVFKRLLRGWDSARIAPVLYVINDNSRLWALSLADGSILLSNAALRFCLDQKLTSASDRLAFVLAHEISHQRTDYGGSGLGFSGAREFEQGTDALRQIAELREREADINGLSLMTVTGFDPTSLIGAHNFFQQWVEKVQRRPCHQLKKISHIDFACTEALDRGESLQDWLTEAAAQAVLFELGMQAFVASDFSKARNYFSTFGRTFPIKNVYTNIGLTYLAEASYLRDWLRRDEENLPPDFMLPLVLDNAALSERLFGIISPQSRGQEASKQKNNINIRSQIKKNLSLAIENFEQAVKLDNDYAQGYIHLIAAYLQDENLPMARGILEGVYQTKFASNTSYMLMKGLLDAADGKEKSAIDQLESLSLQEIEENNVSHYHRLLIYTAAYNATMLMKKAGEERRAALLWQTVKMRARAQGDSNLFRLALAHSQSKALPMVNADKESVTHKVNLKKFKSKSSMPRLIAKPRINGESIFLYYTGHVHIVLDEEGELVSTWQNQGEIKLAYAAVAVGDTSDRLLKTLGFPDREIMADSGEFVAYDGAGIAFRLVDNRIAGWFHYRRSNTPEKGD